jgi:hypothetical protein
MATTKKIKVTSETRKLILDLITMIYDMMDDNRLVPGIKSFGEMKRNARGLFTVLDDGMYDEDAQAKLNTWRKFYIHYKNKLNGI